MDVIEVKFQNVFLFLDGNFHNPGGKILLGKKKLCEIEFIYLLNIDKFIESN